MKLNQQLVFCAGPLRRPYKQGLYPMTRELFDQQNLVGILAAQSVWRIREYDLNLALGREIAYPLESRPFEYRTTNSSLKSGSI